MVTGYVRRGRWLRPERPEVRESEASVPNGTTPPLVSQGGRSQMPDFSREKAKRLWLHNDPVTGRPYLG